MNTVGRVEIGLNQPKIARKGFLTVSLVLSEVENRILKIYQNRRVPGSCQIQDGVQDGRHFMNMVSGHNVLHAGLINAINGSIE